MTERKKDFKAVVRTMLEAYAMGLSTAVGFTPVALILVYMDRLGLWWFPLLLVYFALFFSLEALVFIPIKQRRLHHVIGSEMFYQLYPQELNKALRRVRKIPQPERAPVIEAYRNRIVDTEADVQNRKRGRISTILNIAAAVIVGLLALWCVFGLYRGMQNGVKTDLARMFHVVSTAVMLAVPFTVFKPQFKMVPQIITSVLLGFTTWADIANKLTKPAICTMAPVWEDLIVLGVFIVAGFGLAAAANYLKDGLNTRKKQQEFALAMYELDVIDEKDLDYRFRESRKEND